MFDVLSNDILPVFFMLALGYMLGRGGQVSRDEASAVNRVTFLVLQPGLILPLIAQIDLTALRLDVLALYGCIEALCFAVAYLSARHIFGRARAEAWLLAMAVVFVNSLLYIWPISYLIYGEAAALPITAIVAWDASFSFAFFIISTELIAKPDASAGVAIRKVVTNPVLIAIAIGAALNLASIAIPAPALTAMAFAGAGAAPLMLFALGVILSGQSLRPTLIVGWITGLKLLAFPALVWTALLLVEAPGNWEPLFLLSAAGPSGAMAFSLALLHGIRTDAIAPVIIWTSVLSLFSLAWLA